MRVATNVRLPDLLKHDKLYAAYPFLKTMRVNMIVGEGIPKEREGASLVFALLNVAAWFIVLRFMWERRWFVKV